MNDFEDRLHSISFTGDLTIDKIQRLEKYLLTPRYIGVSENQRELITYKNLLESNQITEEEYNDLVKKSNKPVFCHYKDFDLIFDLFIARYSINLLRDELHWFEYIMLIEMLLEEDDNPLVKRIKARSFRSVSGTEQNVINHNKYWGSLKQKYEI